MEKLKNCKLYKLNKKKTIFKIFSIPSFAQVNDYDFSIHYDYLYIDKSKSKKIKLSKKDRINSYVNLENKKNNMDSTRPPNFNYTDFRVVVNTKTDWLKKAQKKFHKLIVQSIDDIPYLHSTIKKKSYATNAHEHLGDKYFLKIDIKSFFTLVKKELVELRLKSYLDIDGDVAKFYANMLTSPKDKPPFHDDIYNLGQGLPSSPILAFLCHKSFFDYLYNISKENNIAMTIYVDDIAFSSDEPIKQEFIDRLFGLFKMNNLEISKKKFRYYDKNDTKKITGIFIKEGKPMVPSKKHEEIKIQFEYLLENITKITNIDEYFLLYNLFLKFAGNVQHLISSECTIDGNIKIKKQYIKYKIFIEKYSSYFPRGINKNNGNFYSSLNISAQDLKMFKEHMGKLIKITS